MIIFFGFIKIYILYNLFIVQKTKTNTQINNNKNNNKKKSIKFSQNIDILKITLDYGNLIIDLMKHSVLIRLLNVQTKIKVNNVIINKYCYH